MVTISIKSNIDEVAKKLPRAFRRQIPFATAQALSDTARQWKFEEGPKSMQEDLDRPKPWSYKGGLRYIGAKKHNLTAIVRVEGNRWTYLKYQVQGGVQRARGRAIPIQVTDAGLAFFKRNNYGNLKRGAIAKASKRSDTFWAEIGGIYGLWRRVGTRQRQLNLLAIAVPSTEYSKRWDYEGSVNKAVGKYFNKAFAKRLQAAIRTARL